MSFFILQRDNTALGALDRFFSILTKHNLNKVYNRRCGRYRLIVFSNLAGDAPASYETPDGAFIVVLGSIVHKSVGSPACLPGLLAEFEPGNFTWNGLLGTHTIIVHRNNHIYVAGDGLGTCRIYHDRTQRLWSNAFLPFCALIAAPQFDVQACYEYVINGSVFGTRTLLAGVSSLPPNVILDVDSSGQSKQIPRPSPLAHAPIVSSSSMDEIARSHIARLDNVFAPLASNFGTRLRLSFSGGFDSRLMLAMLLRHGVRPSLFVYGSTDDEDVNVARLICEHEGLDLNCIEKRPAEADPEAIPELIEQDLFAFDGWKVEQPLFDLGVDRKDRLARHRDGAVPLNGSLGEIYRNFFYIPDGRSSTGRLVSTFYSPYDPAALTARFVEVDYRAALAAAMRDAIDAHDDVLERAQVEMLYPSFRGRYWTGRDAQLNQRFGPMFFPYLESQAITDTAYIPLRYKDLGRLQGHMIAVAHAGLAAYPSDYGFPLDGARPLKYRLTTWLGTQRPAALRKLSFRLRHRRMENRSGELAPERLARVIDPDLPILRALFAVPRLNSCRQYGLAATLEYLAARFNISIPPER